MLRAYLDGRLLAERVGDGQCQVIGLHGWGRSGSDLLDVLDTEDPNSAIAPDLPGFGATPPPGEPWGAHDYARLVSELIEVEADNPVVVLGHSFGGRVGLCVAADRPDLVAGLILTGVPLLRRSSGKAAVGYRAIKRLHAWHLVGEGTIERARRRHGSPDYNAATGVLRDTFVRVVNESYEDEISAVRCHTDLVWGSADTEAPLRVAEEALAMFEDAELRIIDGGTHDSPLRQPTELRDALRRSTRQLSP